MPRSSKCSHSSLQIFQPKYCMHFSSLPCVLHALPPHPPWYDYPNNIWWNVHVMKPPHYAVFFTLLPFLPFKSKYSQHPVLKHIFGTALNKTVGVDSKIFSSSIITFPSLQYVKMFAHISLFPKYGIAIVAFNRDLETA